MPARDEARQAEHDRSRRNHRNPHGGWKTGMRDPKALIGTGELAALLGDPSLRVFDCTTTTVPPPPGSDVPYIAVPGREGFEEAHIPGADFLDIQGEFSDQTTKLRFM